MEVEYSGGGVLIFSYLILIHQLEHFGGLYDTEVEPRQLDTSEFIGCRFDGPPIAARLYLTNSAKRKRRKPPRSATDLELGRLQSNSTSMVFNFHNTTHMYALEILDNKKFYKTLQ